MKMEWRILNRTTQLIIHSKNKKGKLRFKLFLGLYSNLIS